MLVEWSTDGAAPSRRFEAWRDACCQHIYALTPQRQASEPFGGRIRRHCLGPLDVADIHCDGHLVRRRAEDIRERPSDTYYVYIQREGEVWFEQRGRRQVALPGDIVIADPNVAFDTGAQQAFNFRLWRLERARLAPLLAQRSEVLPMIRLPHADGDGTLIRSWLDAVLGSHASLSATGLDMAFGTLSALVAHVVGLAPEMRERGREGRRAAQLQRCLRLIELRADDPALNAARMAAELAMSPRALHLLFEGTGRTFQETLVQVRLEKAHAMLCSPVNAHASTTEIGLAVGFRDLSTFYRRFKSRYGVAPGELRPAAIDARAAARVGAASSPR